MQFVTMLYLKLDKLPDVLILSADFETCVVLERILDGENISRSDHQLYLGQ